MHQLKPQDFHGRVPHLTSHVLETRAGSVHHGSGSSILGSSVAYMVSTLERHYHPLHTCNFIHTITGFICVVPMCSSTTSIQYKGLDNTPRINHPLPNPLAPIQIDCWSFWSVLLVALAATLVVDRHGDMDVGQDNVAIAFDKLATLRVWDMVAGP